MLLAVTQWFRFDLAHRMCQMDRLLDLSEVAFTKNRLCNNHASYNNLHDYLFLDAQPFLKSGFLSTKKLNRGYTTHR